MKRTTRLFAILLTCAAAFSARADILTCDYSATAPYEIQTGQDLEWPFKVTRQDTTAYKQVRASTSDSSVVRLKSGTTTWSSAVGVVLYKEPQTDSERSTHTATFYLGAVNLGEADVTVSISGDSDPAATITFHVVVTPGPDHFKIFCAPNPLVLGESETSFATISLGSCPARDKTLTFTLAGEGTPTNHVVMRPSSSLTIPAGRTQGVFSLGGLDGDYDFTITISDPDGEYQDAVLTGCVTNIAPRLGFPGTDANNPTKCTLSAGVPTELHAHASDVPADQLQLEYHWSISQSTSAVVTNAFDSDALVSVYATDKDGASSDTGWYRVEVVEPLSIATESLPEAVEREPYAVRLESENGTAPVRWEMVEMGYETGFEDGTFSSNAVASSWSASWSSSTTRIALPFVFPFYGTEYDSVWINGSGCLDFGKPSTENGMYFQYVTNRVCIVPFGDWISVSSPTRLWVERNASSIRFRFSCYGVYSGALEDFSAELFSDGRIRFRYGDTCTSTWSSLNIAVSAGDGRRYVRFDRKTWNGTDDIVFTPGWIASSGELPRGLSLSESGVLSGELAHFGTYPFTVRATDAEGATAVRTFDLNVGKNANLRPVVDGRRPSEEERLVVPVGLPVRLHVSGHDPDGNALEYVWTVNGEEAERNATGDFLYVPKQAAYRYNRVDDIRCFLSDGFWTNEVWAAFDVTVPRTFRLDPECTADVRDGLSWETAFRSFDEWSERDYYDDYGGFPTGIAFLLAPGEYGISEETCYGLRHAVSDSGSPVNVVGVSGPERTVLLYGEALGEALRDELSCFATGIELRPEDGYDGAIRFTRSRWNDLSSSLRRCILRNTRFSFSGCLLQDCLIAGGTGTVSGCTIEHCTIAGNTVPESDDFYEDEEDLRCVVVGGTVVNSIVRDNRGTDGEIRNYPGDAETVEWYRDWYGSDDDDDRQTVLVPAFTNSCTSPMPEAGAGNIAEDPLFAEPVAGDFRLQPGSPCRDAGILRAGLSDRVDLAGYDRFQGALPDMGVYEGGLVWFGDGWRTTSGDTPWTDVSPAGTVSGTIVRSGNAADGGETWMDIDRTGPGTFSFRWRVSSEPRYDRLGVFLDGVVLRRIAGETSWEDFSVSVPDGIHRIRICYAKSSTGSSGEDAGFLSGSVWTPVGTEELTLAAALDTSGLVWETDGCPVWIPQRETTADGVDAARADAPTERSESGLSTRIAGPGVLSFQWLVESDGGICGMDILVDGEVADSCEEDAGWNRRTVSVPAGEHVVRWVFWNDESDEAAFAGLDQVSWTGSVPGPDETRTTPVPVPHAWLDGYGLGDGSEAGYESAAKATAANGVNKVWECYVAGLSPTNAAARFEARIEFDADGKPVVKWTPDLNENGTKHERVYRVLGAKSLGDAAQWDDVTDLADPDAAGYRFFKAKASLPE